MPKNKILILVPGQNARGGITNYYYSIKSEFTYHVDYFLRGSRNHPFRESLLRDILQPFKDFFNFYRKIRKKEYVLLQTATAFDDFSLVRDSFFIMLAKWYKMKVIVFYRGWDVPFADKIEKKYLRFFKFVFFRADAMIDLSSEFVARMKSWGYNKKIYLETTTVNKSLLKDIKEDEIVDKYKNIKSFQILFLSRIEEAKGVYQAVDAFVLLLEKYPDSTLIIAGDGKETGNVKKYVAEKKIPNVTFYDHISGEQKKECYRNSHIYLFPSYWPEGMPNSVLEAMAFGLPVVTRKVGGLIDFFENDKNGYFTHSKDPEVFFGFMDSIISNPELMKNIAVNNHRFAKERFVSDKVAKRLEKIFEEVITER
ncbi:MAG: glycosyltransferase family 4 protein [Bacteroidetes bacterium]|nr:glycosyltransferase family 4 protein [Bacteroidota bacterium]